MAGPSNGGSRQFAGIRRVHLVEADRASRVLIAAAHEVDYRREFGASGREPFCIGGSVINQRIDQPVIAIENKDVIVIKIGFPLAFSGRKLGTNTCYWLSFTGDSAQFRSGTCNSPGSVNLSVKAPFAPSEG
ncbi:MAG: hypothetical protein WA699_17600 [Pseudolabrys sp.]